MWPIFPSTRKVAPRAGAWIETEGAKRTEKDGKRGLGHIEGDGDQSHQCGPRKPGGAAVGELCRMPDANYETFRTAVEHEDLAIRANANTGLLKVTNYPLDQQIRRLEQDFLKEGGLRARMTRSRMKMR